MTIGAIVLLALDSHPLPAGAFSLASYQRLNDIEEMIQARSMLSPDRWNCIEVYYSRTAGGNLAQLASLSGLSSAEDVNFHFVIYNGRGGNDGQIQSTERWLQQYSCTSRRLMVRQRHDYPHLRRFGWPKVSCLPIAN